jgi:hypothetical protein
VEGRSATSLRYPLYGGEDAIIGSIDDSPRFRDLSGRFVEAGHDYRRSLLAACQIVAEGRAASVSTRSGLTDVRGTEFEQCPSCGDPDYICDDPDDCPFERAETSAGPSISGAES